MSTLKTSTSGALRAIPKYRDWLEYVYDSIPSRKALARDCECCELTPTDIIPESLVDTGEKTIITGSGSAHYEAFFTEGHGSFQERYFPQVTWNWGNAGGCSATLYPPLQVVPPSGFAVHGTYGTNINWCLVLTAMLGTASDESWHEYISPDDPPTSGDITASVAFGARLFADIESIGRTNPDNTVWGPRPRYSDPLTKDAVDLRGYKSAEMHWYYWDKDGAGSGVDIGGEVTISAFGYDLTVTGSGPPVAVIAGTADMTNIEPRVKDEDDNWLESYLAMEFFGSPALPSLTSEAPPSPDTVASARTSSHTVYIKNVGSDVRGFRRASLALFNIQPNRKVDIDISLVSPHGLSSGPFDLIPFGGPDRTIVGGKEHPVNTHYPVDDPDTGTDESVEIELTGAGTWSGEGTAYGILARGYVDSPASLLDVMDEKLDTIGNPAFGFVYNSNHLETSGGVSGDNWRCPLRIPADSATWVASQLNVRRNATMPTQPEWSAGPGTTYSANYVSGSGTVSASATLPDSWLIKDYRYLIIRLAQSTPGQSVTLTIGTKTWTAPLPSSADDVVFDLCNPSNGSGFDVTSTAQQVRSVQGGWGWGVDGEATLTLSSAAPFWLFGGVKLESSDLSGQLLVGETLHRWIVPFEVGDITLFPGKSYEETITTYATRGIFYIHDGRVVLDEEWGLTADNFVYSSPPYRAYLVLNIGDVIRAANVRQEDSAPAAVALLEDKAPARFYEQVGWDGAFRWVDHVDFFNNQVESYHLRPTRTSVTGSSAEISADYCVDRIALGVGAHWILTSKKWLSGGLHGLTVVDGVATTATISASTSDTTSRSDGLFVLPGDELLSSNTNYSLSTGWDGSPAQDVVEGTLMRVSVRKS